MNLWGYMECEYKRLYERRILNGEWKVILIGWINGESQRVNEGWILKGEKKMKIKGGLKG